MHEETCSLERQRSVSTHDRTRVNHRRLREDAPRTKNRASRSPPGTLTGASSVPAITGVFGDRVGGREVRTTHLARVIARDVPVSEIFLWRTTGSRVAPATC